MAPGNHEIGTTYAIRNFYCGALFVAWLFKASVLQTSTHEGKGSPEAGLAHSAGADHSKNTKADRCTQTVLYATTVHEGA